jgi:insertion element IS1 protein InsB
MPVLIPVLCPSCHRAEVCKHGHSKEGKQRYRCDNSECPRRTFILNHSHLGRIPSVKQKIIALSHNGSGIRDTARVLNVSTTTVIKELKKSRHKSNQCD